MNFLVQGHVTEISCWSFALSCHSIAWFHVAHLWSIVRNKSTVKLTLCKNDKQASKENEEKANCSNSPSFWSGGLVCFIKHSLKALRFLITLHNELWDMRFWILTKIEHSQMNLYFVKRLLAFGWLQAITSEYLDIWNLFSNENMCCLAHALQNDLVIGCSWPYVWKCVLQLFVVCM